MCAHLNDKSMIHCIYDDIIATDREWIKLQGPHYIKWNAQKFVNSDMHVEKLHMKMVEVFLKNI